MKHIIICVETTKQANTDPLYIDKTIKEYYKLTNEKIDYFYLESKTEYRNKKLSREINKHVKLVGDKNVYVVFCFDTDDYDISIDDKNLNHNIGEFCKENEYYLVWFCKNIEEVFLHKNVSKNEKVKEAIKFHKNSKSTIPVERNLCQNKPIEGTSNFLLIFDQIFQQTNRNVV